MERVTDLPYPDSDFVFDIFTGEQHAINNIWGFFRTFFQATDQLIISSWLEYILLGISGIDCLLGFAMELRLDIIQSSESQSNLLQNLLYF